MKKIIIAVLLSILYPGLGQIYNRERLNAILFIFAQFIVIIVAIVTLGFFPYLILIVWLSGIIEAAFSAKYRNESGEKSQDDDWDLRSAEIILAIVIAAASVYSAWQVGLSINKLTFDKPKKEYEIVQKEVLSYLEEKYKEEFVATNVRYIWATKTYAVSVHSITIPNVNFYAYKLENNTIEDVYKNIPKK